MPLGDALVAATEGAKALAERQVDVQTYSLFVIAFEEGGLQPLFVLLKGKSFRIPVGYGRIAGISGACNIVFLDEIRHNFQIKRQKYENHPNWKMILIRKKEASPEGSLPKPATIITSFLHELSEENSALTVSVPLNFKGVIKLLIRENP